MRCKVKTYLRLTNAIVGVFFFVAGGALIWLAGVALGLLDQAKDWSMDLDQPWDTGLWLLTFFFSFVDILGAIVVAYFMFVGPLWCVREYIRESRKARAAGVWDTVITKRLVR